MAFLDIPSRLEDILDAIDAVQSFVAGKSFDDYQRETMLRLAVERSVEIISEASRHIPAEMKARQPSAPWRNIANIGNVLRHAYPSVDPVIMWEIATQRVEPLRAAVEEMLQEVGPDQTS